MWRTPPKGKYLLLDHTPHKSFVGIIDLLTTDYISYRMSIIDRGFEFTGDQDDLAHLASKLHAVMDEASYVQKSGENDYHDYSYVTEADLTQKIRGPLMREGIMIFMSVRETDVEKSDDITRVTTYHTFVDTETGAALTVESRGHGQDKQDKGIYKAVTGAVKYFLYKTFLIPAGDDPEEEQYVSGRVVQQMYQGAKNYGLSKDEFEGFLKSELGITNIHRLHESRRAEVKNLIQTHGEPPVEDKDPEEEELQNGEAG